MTRFGDGSGISWTTCKLSEPGSKEVMVMVMVNVDLYSAIITKVSNALDTLVSGEKPGFQTLSEGLVVLLCAEVVRQRVPDHGAVHSECSACTAPWSGTLCRTTSAHSRTTSPSDISAIVSTLLIKFESVTPIGQIEPTFR